MNGSEYANYLWGAILVLVLGSGYLIYLAYHVHKVFADSIVGKLVKALVVILLITLYSLGVVCYTLLKFYPKGITALLPIVILWIISLGFAIFSVKSAKDQVLNLTK